MGTQARLSQASQTPMSHPPKRPEGLGAPSQVGGPPQGASPPRSSLGIGSVLGHGNLGGHQEEDVSLQVHHGLLLGLLGCVEGPGLSVDVKGGVGTPKPLGDGEPTDQLVEVLSAGTMPALAPLPSANGRVSAPPPSIGPQAAPPNPGLTSVSHPWALPPRPRTHCLLRDLLAVLVDGGHVDAGKDVAVHVVGARYVVNVGRVGVQVDGVIGDEVSVDDREEAQIVQHGIWVGERRALTRPVPRLDPGPTSCLL